MPRKRDKLVRVAAVEILPPHEVVKLPAAEDASFQKLAQEVARILAADKDLQPWFTSPAFAQEVRRQQTVEERYKFADFFERYGCFRCRSKRYPHNGNALCLRCRNWFRGKLEQCMKERRQERAKR